MNRVWVVFYVNEQQHHELVGVFSKQRLADKVANEACVVCPVDVDDLLPYSGTQEWPGAYWGKLHDTAT